MALLVSLFFPLAAGAQWHSQGTLKVPKHHYSFLAATPNGDLIAATFNRRDKDKPPAEIPVLLIRHPLSATPEVVELHRESFAAQRGYGGVVCAPDGSFFLSGDTGRDSTCFVRKFRPDGTPDPNFGRGGELRPGRRCLGLDILGSYLLLAIDWGEIQVLSASDGQQLGRVPKVQGDSPYVRDIAIDPRTLRIFGVAEGGVVCWEDGAPWEPERYRSRQLAPKAGHLRAGEGISIDPLAQAAIVHPVPGNTLFTVREDGRIAHDPILTANPNTYLVDSVLSFDGETLFVSDIDAMAIHVLKRGRNENPTAPPTPSIPPLTLDSVVASPIATSTVPKVEWKRSYTESVEQARRARHPMVVYFRLSGVSRCETFEHDVLLSSEFDRQAPGFVCVFEDLAIDRLIAYRFGVFRVPHVVVLDARGEIVETLTYDIPAEKLFAAMKRALPSR